MIRQIDNASFHHFDPYAQVLAKIERGHAQDLVDARQMLHRNMVNAERLGSYFESMEPMMYRFPAVDAATFRKAVNEFLKDA